MGSKKKGKALILSISFLLLIIILYNYEGGRAKSAKEEGNITIATIVKENSIKFYNFSSEKISEIKAKIDEMRAEKARLREEEAKRLAELADNEASNTVTISVDVSEELPFVNLEEGVISVDEKNLIFTAGDGTRYVTITSGYDVNGKPEVHYFRIPSEMDGIEFRPVNDTVYSAKAAKLYGSPGFTGGALKTAGRWEAFTRVGISDDCCYQLVSSDGQILYADGLYFRRYREDMELTEEIPESEECVSLDVKCIYQNPTLPTGCEVTSLAIVLKYLGFNVSKETLSDNYLPKAPVGEANFFDEFVGNPRNASSYGCYSGAIVTTANKYLEEAESEYKAVDYTGSSFYDLLKKVREGNPVIIWVTTPISENPGYTTEWIVDGEYIIWKANLHCLVLTGYDLKEKKVTTADPLRGTVEYDLDIFVKRFKQFYSQAVIIE